MDDDYGIPDLRHLISGRPLLFPATSHPQPYDTDDVLIINGSDCSGANDEDASASARASFTENGRWPRQETLTLLEIRSSLDSKFKEANQKGPLWDEVSRIMCEEHEYYRSAKKCREKFENLYKYYKKTKEGKAGRRQDGKHFGFFRQLEALNSTNDTAQLHLRKSQQMEKNLVETSLSRSNCSDPDWSSSSLDKEKEVKRRKSWKAKMLEIIEMHMKKLMDKQDAWMEKMIRVIEEKDRERTLREEEWRRQHAARIDKEHQLWDTQRAWIEARDSALIQTLNKLAGKQQSYAPLPPPPQPEMQMTNSTEINMLIQMKTSLEERGISEDILWEEISATMTACFGYETNAFVCKQRWECVNDYLLKCCRRKNMDNSSKCCSDYQHFSLIHQGQGGEQHLTDDQDVQQAITKGVTDHQDTAGIFRENCLMYIMGDGYQGINH